MISIGDRLDAKYLVTGRLGSGGFGVVFLAEDEAIPGRCVALKALSGPPAAAEDNLIWEMLALSQFNHPGVVAFHHHFSHQSQRVLVMEYCPGGSLADRLDATGAMAENEVFRWAAVLCDTLAAVHGKGIVHHDIKPANVLLSRDGAIKLGDFGVANRNTGTRMYLAPEMLLGPAPAKTDPRVDVYALGLTLVEMLTGEHPFELLSPEQALAARMAHQTVPASLPRWVQEVLLRATHPTPELRFQSMAAFGEAIASQRVPFVLNGNHIKAHALAEKSERHLARKQWKLAEKLANQALLLSPDCTAALLAAGRCQLLIRRTQSAREFFIRALDVNPRIHVQKELGWLQLEEGHLPIAISLLSDHLDRHGADFEACNLLLKCFYLSARYDVAEGLAQQVLVHRPVNPCFENNRFICRLLAGDCSVADLKEARAGAAANPFLAYNLAVATESPRSWSEAGGPVLLDKLVLQEFRFDVAGKANPLSIRLADGSRTETSEPLVSIGLWAKNDIALDDTSVSRRHALIANYPNDVWLYDLGSTRGSRLDGDAVTGRAFLDGVHRVMVGRVQVEIGSRADLLV